MFDFVYTLTSANIDHWVPNSATLYMLIRSQMSLIKGEIEPEHPELFALEFGKIAEYDLIYTLASTNINQWTLNLVKMYVIIRSQMNFIMDLIGFELSKSPLNYKIWHIWLCLKSSICRYWPISIKLGKNINVYKVLNEFNYWTNQTRISKVICPWFGKNCWIWLFLHSCIYKY